MARRPPRVPPPSGGFSDEDREAVLATNRGFYRAFNDRDLAAIDALLAPTGPAICAHPGQQPLTTRAATLASWRAILAHPAAPRARCAEEWVTGSGNLALVVCREILPTAQLIATNTYVRHAAGWKMIGHHSGQVPVVARLAPPAPRDRRKLH
ncbi:MAG: nuclear transport factor 2 family protein [Alphaproteobacteria bacterium]|nr:nuclear transport factor 2 family protein [Alphaproteobacteria bacterium]